MGPFPGCSSLTNIAIPNTVVTIEGSAFAGCSALTSITIPNSVTAFDIHVFMDCTSLTTVTFEGALPEGCVDAFGDCGSLINLKIDSQEIVDDIYEGEFDYTDVSEYIINVYIKSNLNDNSKNELTLIYNGCQDVTFEKALESEFEGYVKYVKTNN